MTRALDDPHTVAEMVDRAGRLDYERWAEQVSRCGHCARPVRLRGRVRLGRREVYSTEAEPDRVLLVRCRNRRASVCPSCSYEYAGDMWQLLYAGAAGGRKGVPDSVRAHPLVFVTLTAPGFGTVHTTRADRHGRRGRCRPWGESKLCGHQRPVWCGAVHREEDELLGTPLCSDCYDYPGHVKFNWWAPELWRRFTITLRRVLARRLGLSVAELTRAVRVSFAKVAEFQRRGVIHLHALIRLDGSDPFTSPDLAVTAIDLAEAVEVAAGVVQLVVHLPADERPCLLRFGEQVDVQVIGSGTDGELTPERVAAYLAKYSTKSAEDFGLGERRLSGLALDGVGVSAHVARIVRTAWELGAADELIGLRRWLHMLGFRGHFATKSRSYSTTLGAIRRERSDYRRSQVDDARPIGIQDQADDDTTLVIAQWEFAGLGHLTGGDAALALSAAARARERREAARDHIRAGEEDH
jgi:hypothetical protein